MSYRSAVFAMALVAASTVCTFGDNVVLKSGDTLSGTIVSIGPETIDLSTSFAGMIKIKRETVKSLRSDAKVTVINPQGESHAAYVSPVEGAAGWQETPAAVPVTAVAVVPPPPPSAPAPEPAKVYNLNLEPYWLPIGPDWKNQLVLGVTTTSGNTNSTTVAAGASFAYNTKPQEFTLKLGTNYEMTNDVQTAGQAYMDAIYRRSFPQWDKSEGWYAFAENHELYDAIKGISLRSTTAFGPGYFLVKQPNIKVDVRTGPAYVYERFFNGDTNSDLSGLAGLRIEYVVNARSTLSENALYTVATNDTTRYQITSDTAFDVKLPELARGMGLKFDFRDDYDNTAVDGNKQNDTRFTLALTLDF